MIFLVFLASVITLKLILNLEGSRADLPKPRHRVGSSPFRGAEPVRPAETVDGILRLAAAIGTKGVHDYPNPGIPKETGAHGLAEVSSTTADRKAETV